jgi:glycosyltransferase involved in cell wall biosynthesis
MSADGPVPGLGYVIICSVNLLNGRYDHTRRATALWRWRARTCPCLLPQGMNSKIKIGVWLTSTPHGGGSFQYALLTLLALSEIKRKWPDKYELVCFSPRREWKTFIEEDCPECVPDFQVVKRPLIQRAIGRLVRASTTGLRVWRMLNKVLPLAYSAVYRSQVDVIVCTASDSLGYEVAIPTISIIHDLMHRYEPAFPEVGSAGIVRERERVFRSMCRFCRVLLVDSQLGKQQVIESYGDVLHANVMVLPFLPASYILNHDTKRDYSSVREKYSLPEQYIFYPAQFWEHKNHRRLVEAIKLLQQRGIAVNAVFAGSANNSYASVMQLIDELGLRERIRVLGYVPDDDIVGLYKSARALVMPTFFGPTNIPPLEAFFLGVPVACSNIYAMPEQVGDAALLFDPRSVGDIAEKVDRLWTDAHLRNELVKRGYDRARDMTIEKYARHWEMIIEAVVKSSQIPSTVATARLQNRANGLGEPNTVRSQHAAPGKELY